MNKFIKTMSIFLVVLLCAGVFAACSNGNDQSAEQSGSAGGTLNRGDYNYGPYDYGEFPYEDYSFSGDPIRVLCVESARHTYGVVQFAPESEAKGTAVSTAVQQRNDMLKEKYGIEFAVTATNKPSDTISLLVKSTLDEYDVVCESVDNLVQGVAEDIYYSLDEYVDLSMPWWDYSSIDALSLTEKHYFLTGDAILTDDDNTYLTLYNKDMYSKNSTLTGYGDIYDIVRRGDFTIDLYTEMCKAVSTADENGNWGSGATFGNLSHSYGATIMMNGLGIATVSKNTNDELTLNVGTEKAINAFAKVYELMSDKQNTARAELLIGQIPGGPSSQYGFAELSWMFINQHGLFYNTTSSSITSLKSKNLEFEFGVLPIPKLEKGTDTKYACAVNRYHSSALAIPTSLPRSRIPDVVFALNAMGFNNANVIRAYYQTTLQLQAVHTDNDAEMLDIVYNNRFYDLGAIYGWGKAEGIYGTVIADSTANTIVSKWESVKGAVEGDMQKDLEGYRNSKT